MSIHEQSEQSQEQEVRRLVLWSSFALGLIAILGFFAWSYSGTAVYFDRLSAAFANCF